MTGGAIETALADFLAREKPERLGLAVSGGGDSMALLHLAAAWARETGVPVEAVTVDHGLRAEASGEAALVARAAAGLGVTHRLLCWSWDGRGNLPDRARQARLALIGGWARERGLAAVALGHTSDDLAETFLMRLSRGAGIDGLSAMAPSRRAAGMLWLRPLLGIGREALRDWLRDRGIGWAEDPTNEDQAYLRARARSALAALAPLGIGAAALAATAERLADARAALQAGAEALARRLVRTEAGEVLFDREGFFAAPGETRARLLSAAIRHVGRDRYPPRHAPLVAALAALAAGKRAVLGGCLLSGSGRMLRVGREYRALGDISAAPDALWDGRWQITAPKGAGADLAVRALGAEGLALCPQWRDTGLKRATLMTTPAIWRGDRLIAAPLAGRAEGWRAEPVFAADDYFVALLSH